MPTTLPRHTITETSPVREALDQLRAQLPQGEKIDYGELIVLGAKVKARKLDTEGKADRAALDRLIDMVRTRSIPVDSKAAEEVKHLKLIPKYE